MEKFEYQGKRKDQVESSETIVVLSVVGILVIIGIVATMKLLYL